MKSKKITAAVLGIVLTLGLVVSGCGNSNGASSDGSAKAETGKDGYEVVSIGFPSAGYEWAEGALAVAEDNYALYETLDEITCILEEYVIKVNQSLFEASYNYAFKQSQNLLKENNNFSMFDSIEKLKDFLIENGAPKDELNNKLAKLNGSEKLDEDATDRILKEYYEMQNNSSELSNE